MLAFFLLIRAGNMSFAINLLHVCTVFAGNLFAASNRGTTYDIISHLSGEGC